MFKAKGRRGSWFAEVNGQSLPCVWTDWSVKERHRGLVSYNDPGVTAERMEQFKELHRAICTEKVVILRQSKETTKVGGGNEHQKYVSMWEVADAELTDTNLTFRYVRKIDDHY